MKASRYIAEFLKSKGLNHVFGLQGGAVVHLFDSCERFGPKPIYCHHEQAAAFAACSFARVMGYGVCIVTTGPGATNAITPLLGAWQNYTPMMFISGQARLAQTSYGKGVRQVGMQEAPIVNVVRALSKLAFLVTEAAALPAQIENAFRVSLEKPSGPVWIDVPLDIQWSEL